MFRSGQVRWGNPDGRWPATCTPAASPPSSPITIVAVAMTTSAAGIAGARWRSRSIAATGCDWRSRNVRQVLQDVPKLREEVAGRAADPEKMRHLAHDGDVDQPFDEATHHGCGDEARDPTHTYDSKTEEEEADQNGEGRGQRVEFRRSLRRYGANGHRRDQTSRSVRPHHELPRRAEQRIGD